MKESAEAKTPPPRKRVAKKKPPSVTTTTTVTPVDPDTVQAMISAFEEQAGAVAKQAVEFQESWVDAVAAENIVFKRRNKVLVVLASVIAAMCAASLLFSGVLVYRAFYQTGPLLHRLDDNQEGIDSLVSFVEDVKAQQGNGQQDAVQELLNILCASSDPVRVEACAAINTPPQG